MNEVLLADALERLRKRLLKADEEPLHKVDTDDAAECVAVLARIVRGKTLTQALGAPGDWGGVIEYAMRAGARQATLPKCNLSGWPIDYGTCEPCEERRRRKERIGECQPVHFAREVGA